MALTRNREADYRRENDAHIHLIELVALSIILQMP